MDQESPEPSRKAAPVTYEPGILLAFTSPSQMQRRAALIIVLGLAIEFVITVPFLAYPLPQINAFIPAFESAIFICYLITAGLLFAQYVVSRSHALLVLASGYLFATLIVIPHALTFPGAFGSTGPLGGGSQSTGWLYFVWHCGFALFVIGYALIKDVDRGTAGEQGSAVGTISSIIGIMIALICGLTWAINAHESNLPRLIGADVSFLARHVPGVVMLVLGLLAIALLWRRRISVLDLWLIVVMFAFLFEIMRVAIGNYPRFSFGFYTVRIFSLVTSTIVLLVLLSQTTALYARVARSNMMLQREQNNKLMSLEAMAAHGGACSTGP